jgi:hypothetical protein
LVRHVGAAPTCPVWKTGSLAVGIMPHEITDGNRATSEANSGQSPFGSLLLYFRVKCHILVQSPGNDGGTTHEKASDQDPGPLYLFPVRTLNTPLSPHVVQVEQAVLLPMVHPLIECLQQSVPCS